MTSNLVKSFNSWLRHERHHNVTVFFIEHMDKVGTLLANHHKWNGSLGPNTQKVRASNISRDETYITHPFIGGLIKFDTGFSCHKWSLFIWANMYMSDVANVWYPM